MTRDRTLSALRFAGQLSAALTLLATVGLFAAAESESLRGWQQTAKAVTFTHDIAPILFESCAVCHRPYGPAPFSLLTYDEARGRSRQIAQVTRNRYMPPWKPEPGYGEFVGERSLTDAQIELIQRWAQTGAAEGNASDLPPVPLWAAGWQIGEPDLVVRLPEYTLPAEGPDVFRNFAVPVPGTGKRFVRGLEFRPSSRAIHHANIFVDDTPTSRRWDDEDPLPGYTGLIPNSAMFPDGYFLGWTPAQVPPLAPKSLAWPLDAGSDLLVQMHMMPTGQPERIQPSIGLFFTREPPTHTPAILRLGKKSIDIPPGERAYRVSSSYVVPVDVQIHAVQPHAHYRATEVKAWASLPDGSRRELIFIRQWDFNWQDQYRYEQPFWLPAGTVLTLEFTYDNSAENPRNPDFPPRRVLWGFRSSDEMGDLWIQCVMRSERDRAVLNASIMRKMTAEDIIGSEIQIRVNPNDVALRNDLAVLYLETGQPDRAAAHFEWVVGLQPDAPSAHFNLAGALDAAGNAEGALAHYREAVRLNPTYLKARTPLADAMLVLGRFEEAVSHYQQIVRLAPDRTDARNNLGYALIHVGRVEDGIAELGHVLELQAEYPEAHYNLAYGLSTVGQANGAADHFREALRLRPDWLPALKDLAWLLATTAAADVRDPEGAVRLASRAFELSPDPEASILDVLAAAYAAVGRFGDAIRTAEAAEKLGAATAPELVAAIRERLQLYRAGEAVVVLEP